MYGDNFYLMIPKIIGTVVMTFLLASVSSLSLSSARELNNVVSLQNGERILVSNNENKTSNCRVTVFDTGSAFTAGHCGDVGSVVFNEKGEALGSVVDNFLQNGNGVDAARISLKENIRAIPLNKGQEYKVQQGHNFLAILSPNTFEPGIWEKENLIQKSMSLPKWKNIRVTVAVSNLRAEPGDSGAPVVNEDHEIIGMIQGGNLKNQVNVTLFQSMP